MRGTDQRAGFEEFVRSREKQWLRSAYALSGDWHSAQDVVQSVLTKLYVNWPRVQQAQQPDAYVRTCMVNAFLDTRRRPWRRESASAEPSDHHRSERDGVDVVERIDQRDELISALRCLPAGQRTVLVLRFFEDLDVESVARTLDCTTGTVKSQTAKGLDNLRRILPTREETP